MPAISDEVLLESAVFLYLACAKLTDGDLDPREALVVGERVRELVPRLTPAYGDDLMRDVAQHFSELAEPATILEEVVRSAERLAEGLQRDELEAVVRGLIDIAGADDEVTDNERDYVLAVARTFGIDAKVDGT